MPGGLYINQWCCSALAVRFSKATPNLKKYMNKDTIEKGYFKNESKKIEELANTIGLDISINSDILYEYDKGFGTHNCRRSIIEMQGNLGGIPFICNKSGRIGFIRIGSMDKLLLSRTETKETVFEPERMSLFGSLYLDKRYNNSILKEVATKFINEYDCK